MISLFLCFVTATVVFGLNNTNVTINEEKIKLILKNKTNEKIIQPDLKNTNITAQVPQNSTFDTITTEIKTKSVIKLQKRDKTGQLTKRVQLETQKKSKNPRNKKILPKPNQRAKENMPKPKPRKPIKRDLPDMLLKPDLDEIMSSLHKMIDFFLENEEYVDISLYYGLFILDVNLNKVFKEKRHKLPSAVTFSLKHLLEKNEHLVNYFRKMVDSDVYEEDKLSKTITSLFRNEPLWIERIPYFDGASVNDTVNIDYDELKSRYSSWDDYLDKVRDFDQAVPRPDQSDRCLGELAKNPVHKTPWKKHCKISNGCRIPLDKGSQFGYGLTHRLLYLQLAYYDHRCFVFSVKKDRDMREKFCKSLYEEASYISMNDYLAIDLFAEQLCLCALDGHYEFLRRSWLMGILSFQSPAGCFSETMPDSGTPQRQAEPDNWRLDRGKSQYVLDKQCNLHTSAAAGATLGFGVKFIIETFY